MKIKTDHKWKNFKYGYELPKGQRHWFDYLDDIDSGTFIQYRGHWYSLDQFMQLDSKCPIVGNWDGVHNDSYFSGVLIRISEDCEQYQIATYIS